MIAGRAAPGAKVQILDGDKTLGQVTADNRDGVLKPGMPVEADLSGAAPGAQK